MSVFRHESRRARNRAGHIAGVHAEGRRERPALCHGGRAAAARHDDHPLRLPGAARPAAGPVELRARPRRIRHPAVDERAPAGPRTPGTRRPPGPGTRRPGPADRADRPRAAPAYGGQRRGPPRRARHARQSGYRRARSDAAPAHRVHRLTDPTARTGHVTAPEFTTLPCPWVTGGETGTNWPSGHDATPFVRVGVAARAARPAVMIVLVFILKCLLGRWLASAESGSAPCTARSPPAGGAGRWPLRAVKPAQG